MGGNGTKTFNHLIAELNKGECTLDESYGNLVRRIRTVMIDVYYLNTETQQLYKLIEKEQVFKTGERRVRNQICSVAEKLPITDPVDNQVANHVAVNALREELGITESVLSIWSTDKYLTLSHSKSYPGLNTLNEVYCFTAYLTPAQYKSEGYIEYQADKTNYFVWAEECPSES